MIREYIYFVDDNPNGTSGMTEEEIVRCKDCKHYSNGHLCQYFSRHGTIETKETDFCSFGERRAEQ